MRYDRVTALRGLVEDYSDSVVNSRNDSERDKVAYMKFVDDFESFRTNIFTPVFEEFAKELAGGMHQCEVVTNPGDKKSVLDSPWIRITLSFLGNSGVITYKMRFATSKSGANYVVAITSDSQSGTITKTLTELTKTTTEGLIFDFMTASFALV